MRTVHIPCGAFANASEARAFREVDASLRRANGEGSAYVLTNLTFANPHGQADEIDMVVIGPGGAVVVEVKHWDAASLRRNPDLDHHAALIIAKAKRIAGRLRAKDPKLEFVPAAMLFTRERNTLCRNGRQAEHLGIRIYALKDVGELLARPADEGSIPTERLARALAPRLATEGGVAPRRFARFDDLKLLTPIEDTFARVHAARDPASGDRVIIHSYDLSAAPALESPELTLRRAKREFDVVQRFQKSPYLPSLVDSWQLLPNYAGEIFFFTLADSAAISVEQLRREASWSKSDRLVFASRALRALAELQMSMERDGEPLIHRNLSPSHVRVRANNVPLFAGWRWARLPASQTIASGAAAPASDQYTAPEVRDGGFAAAVQASDVYSLCAVLTELFDGDSPEEEAVRSGLATGLEFDATRRSSPADIADQLDTWEPISSTTAVAAVPASRWDEGHVLCWNGDRYRIVALLGQGAAGRTFKLEQLDGDSDDPIGAFVGKAVFNPLIGETSLQAYKKIRSFARHDSLSDVLQTSAIWSPNELMALLRWVRGEPLDAWRGEVQFLAEHTGAPSVESLLLRWFGELCAALDVLHVQGWVHGDVSPSNILVDDDRVVLIDYDLASPAGQVAISPGTVGYCSPERRAGAPVQPSDDLYALAASLFHVLTDRSPLTSGVTSGLPWTADERHQLKRLSTLLDVAVDPISARRFENAGAARRRLLAETAAAAPNLEIVISPPTIALEFEPLRPNIVNRVKDILRAYPGSRFGNAETRGLDTEFASDTYVETGLDRTLPEAVMSGAVSLIILCGNAGDGKTAFLQHLAAKLGAQSLPSSQRVWNGQLHGRKLKINLDGAASWNGLSADELLDDLFAPFHQGSPKEARSHLVAVNDGRLMEWIERYEGRHDGVSTPLTRQLAASLGGDGAELDPHIRLVELNERSLVGGVNATADRIQSEFIDNLIAKLVGGERAPSIWKPCRTCTARARCPMRRSAEMMGASDDSLVLDRGRLLRDRLTAALQAVHQRNEVHITTRELKAALSYILFGLYACEDLHANPDLPLHALADHAFDPLSQQRQGELLRELARLDPALEAHAGVDRYLKGQGPPDHRHGARRYQDAQGRPLPLRQARRQAYFDWSADQIKAVGGEPGALGLKDGRRFAQFRDFPLLPSTDQQAIKLKLCEGLSRLEDLPDAAFRVPGVVPIRIVPRTTTETAFWVGKPLERFVLEAERFNAPEGMETLHRYLSLIYQPLVGSSEELTVSLELYALLMDLAEGVQILDAFSDDVFANLGVFTQRLAQEDERSVRAWNPADEERIYAIDVKMQNAGQTITLTTGPA